jgi:hypothetical protein
MLVNFYHSLCNLSQTLALGKNNDAAGLGLGLGL